jgi:hypothetical protein
MIKGLANLANTDNLTPEQASLKLQKLQLMLSVISVSLIAYSVFNGLFNKK